MLLLLLITPPFATNEQKEKKKIQNQIFIHIKFNLILINNPSYHREHATEFNIRKKKKKNKQYIIKNLK